MAITKRLLGDIYLTIKGDFLLLGVITGAARGILVIPFTTFPNGPSGQEILSSTITLTANQEYGNTIAVEAIGDLAKHLQQSGKTI